MVLKAVKALGIARARWVRAYFPECLIARRTDSILKEMISSGELVGATMSGWSDPVYMLPESHDRARAAVEVRPPNLTTLLTPFDPLVADRARVKELFGFEYKIEVYTPAHKRRFGYFTLPILHHGAVVGRLDPKAHRAEGRFEVKALALEPGVKATDELAADLGAALRGLAAWHGTPELVIGRTQPKDLVRRLLE